MPPSPALRCSPGREPRARNYERGHSFDGGLLLEKDEDLALFNEMQTRERENFLLQSSDDLEESFSTKLRYFSDVKLGISIPARGESSDLLTADGEKNDYDWLITPPDTPLFPSLDDEPLPVSSAQRGRPRSQPISITRSSTMEKSYRSSRVSASPNRLSPSPRSGNSTFQSRGRPSSVGPSSPSSARYSSPSSIRHSSPSPILRHATPSRRPSTPPSKTSTPASRSSTPTHRRTSTGPGASMTSPGIRGTSPVKKSRGDSASPKIKAWQANIPGFSSDPPPNLRTSLSDRPAAYVRGSSPASRNGRDSSSKFRRQSMSPTPSRSVGSPHSHEGDPFSSHSKGSIGSSADDDLDSLQPVPVGSLDRSTPRRVSAISNNRTLAVSKKPTRIVSPSSAPKRSFDSAIRQMDHRKSPQNMFRPLLSSVPSTTFHVGKSSSAHRHLISRNSSVTTSSNASSEQGTSVVVDTKGSDHNYDDTASECQQTPYSDVHEEMFSFDKIDIEKGFFGNEIPNESIDIHSSNFDRGSRIECHPAGHGISCQHDSEMGVDPISVASHVKDEFLEVDSLENMALCSICGRKFNATDQKESEDKFCLACSRKDELLSITALETAMVVEASSQLLINVTEVEKPFHELSHTIVVPKLLQNADADESKRSLDDEEHDGEGKVSYLEQSDDYVQENSLAKPEVKEGDRLAKQQETGLLAVHRSLPNIECIGEKLFHSDDYLNPKVYFSEGAGISVLLNRTNSSKGPVVQGRTFKATSVPYGDLSHSKDSLNSMRSSTGHWTSSASSSTDYNLAKQTENQIQRQPSGKKSEMENQKYDMSSKSISSMGVVNHVNQALGLSISSLEDNFQVSDYDKETDAGKPETINSSFTRIANYDHQALDLSSTTHDDNFQYFGDNKQCNDAQKTPLNTEEQVLSSRCTEADNTSASLTMVAIGEDDYDHKDSRIADASSTVLLRDKDVTQLGDKLALLPACEGFVTSGKCSDFRNNAINLTEIEPVVASSESSFKEENAINVDELGNAQLAAHSCLIASSEIESEKSHQVSPGSGRDDASLALKSTLDEVSEPSVLISSNMDVKESVLEPTTSDQSQGVLEQGSTVMVDCHKGRKTRSLTLEEATDTILFCSSIVHDLAYQAANIAMEKESSTPLESSQPTVTVLGKSRSQSWSQQCNVQANFGLTHSAISPLQSLEGPEVTSATNINKQEVQVSLPHALSEEDFLEIDDLLGPEPTLTNMDDTLNNMQFDNGLSELDLFYDAAMFLEDIGPIDQAVISSPYVNSLEHTVGNHFDYQPQYNQDDACLVNDHLYYGVGDTRNNQLYPQTANQVNSQLYSGGAADINNQLYPQTTNEVNSQLYSGGAAVINNQLYPQNINEVSSRLYSGGAAEIDNHLSSDFHEWNGFNSVGSEHGSFYNTPSGVVSDPPNLQAGSNENQSGSNGIGSPSRLSSALWAFVEAIPTTPASAASESALVNRALERLSSFSRTRVNARNSNNVAAVNNVETTRRKEGRKSSFVFFPVVVVVCAILWVMLGTIRQWGISISS